MPVVTDTPGCVTPAGQGDGIDSRSNVHGMPTTEAGRRIPMSWEEIVVYQLQGDVLVETERHRSPGTLEVGPMQIEIDPARLLA
jgi:hypothetical protein